MTSLGGERFEADEWNVDVAYSGTQKCLSCPPGLAPVTFSERAVEKLKSRESKVVSWYLDLSMIEKYWTDGERAYHHTAPISAIFGLAEGLRIVLEEGLDARAKRHREAAAKLIAPGVE